MKGERDKRLKSHNGGCLTLKYSQPHMCTHIHTTVTHNHKPFLRLGLGIATRDHCLGPALGA